MSGFERISRISLRETRLAATLAAAALFRSSGTLASPSSRAAAFERTISWVSLSFAMFDSWACEQHPLSPARPRYGRRGSGGAALQRLGNGHSNARRAAEVQSV